MSMISLADALWSDPTNIFSFFSFWNCPHSYILCSVNIRELLISCTYSMNGMFLYLCTSWSFSGMLILHYSAEIVHYFAPFPHYLLWFLRFPPPHGEILPCAATVICAYFYCCIHYNTLEIVYLYAFHHRPQVPWRQRLLLFCLSGI